MNRDDEDDILTHLRAIREHLHALNNSVNALVLKVEIIRRFLRRLVRHWMP